MGRFQLAVSGSNTLLLDTENGNVYTPVVHRGEEMIWKLHIRGDVLQKDRVTRALRTLPSSATP